MADEFEGVGGSYLIDAKGNKTLLFRTDAPAPEKEIIVNTPASTEESEEYAQTDTQDSGSSEN